MNTLLGNLPPGTSEPTSVITRKLFVNGVAVPDTVGQVSYLSVNKTFNKIAYAKVLLQDGDAAGRDFLVSNQATFKPGNTLKVQLGYDGEATTVFEGIILKHAVKARSGGQSQLVIEAKNKAIKLAAGRKNAYFINKTDAQIWETIAHTAELTLQNDPLTFVHKQMVQYDATDWDFLLSRAEMNGMLVLTDDDHLVIKTPSTTGGGTPTVATYGDNIIEFEAEMDAHRQLKQVKGQSWNSVSQSLDSAIGQFSLTETGNVSAHDLGAIVGADVVLHHPNNLENDQLSSWANAYAMKNQLAKAVGRVRIRGNATLKPGQLLRLSGVGDRFNGTVYITGILHQYTGGWETDVQFGWTDEWFYQKENIMDKPAAGLLPGVGGLQVGRVLAAPDTDQKYRIKVHIPRMGASDEGIWARVATLSAGAGHGVVFRPQTGDEVVLGFLNDDPRNPVVLGYFHNKDSQKAELFESEPKLEGILTKAGIQVILDDTHKLLKLRVPTDLGEKTLILNQKGAFAMNDDFGNSITMDSTGISIKAGTGKNVTIKGTRIDLNPPG